MLKPPPLAANFARALGDCRSGVAFIEFAFALPVLLALGLLGLETANYAMANLRVSNIAMLTADNAARVRDSIDEADVVELFTGAKMSGSNINFAANGRIILTDLEPTSTGGKQWVRWQRCDGALNYASTNSALRPLTSTGTAITNGTEIYATDRTTPSTATAMSSETKATMTSVGSGSNVISASAGSAVMLVEVAYNYQPVIPNSFLSGRQITYTSAFNVRQRTDQTLRNINRITPKSCNLFAA
ncbi:TadE/TadG family type IV pilus assembly protein [Allosphingosinicella sp.]|uniref:TadE/TadG family type IV pilus assembly protein n=1 Tax=Allosphingosinicella sp. TaxID=2823234 RepID=UPI003783C473